MLSEFYWTLFERKIKVCHHGNSLRTILRRIQWTIKQLIKYFYNNAILNDSQSECIITNNKDSVFKFLKHVSMEMGLSASHKGHITKIIY